MIWEWGLFSAPFRFRNIADSGWGVPPAAAGGWAAFWATIAAAWAAEAAGLMPGTPDGAGGAAAFFSAGFSALALVVGAVLVGFDLAGFLGAGMGSILQKLEIF